jgi:hypothetical protein
MAENQTRETGASVSAFIEAIPHEGRREDTRTLVALMRRITRTEPKMWGPAIIGFGSCHYKYESGREGDMPRLGFSPRKANLALYLMTKTDDYAAGLKRLGKHKTAGSCLYVNRLSDVDKRVLEEMIRASWRAAKIKFGK